MSKELIKCPECGAEFELSQAISRDIEEAVSRKYSQKIKVLETKAKAIVEEKEAEFGKRIKEEKARLEKKEKEFAEEMDVTEFEGHNT